MGLSLLLAGKGPKLYFPFSNFYRQPSKSSYAARIAKMIMTSSMKLTNQTGQQCCLNLLISSDDKQCHQNKLAIPVVTTYCWGWQSTSWMSLPRFPAESLASGHSCAIAQEWAVKHGPLRILKGLIFISWFDTGDVAIGWFLMFSISWQQCFAWDPRQVFEQLRKISEGNLYFRAKLESACET